jgi:hypothetical protein
VEEHGDRERLGQQWRVKASCAKHVKIQQASVGYLQVLRDQAFLCLVVYFQQLKRGDFAELKTRRSGS